jgi:hypothetical protein
MPSLSTKGWVTDDSTKLDALISHAYLADYNQTHLYVDEVISYPRIMQECGGDADIAVNTIRDETQKYLKRYYPDGVIVETELKKPITETETNRMDIIISIRVITNNKTTDFVRLLKSSNSVIEGIVKINNFG